MKHKITHVSLIAATALATASFASAATLTQVGATVTETFDTAPVATDWSTVGITGNSSTATTAAELDTIVNNGSGTKTPAFSTNLALAALASTTGTGGGNAARYNSATKQIFTKPLSGAYTGTAYTALMATVTNNTGAVLNSVSLSYDLSVTPSNNENVPGHRVFYSLTGAAGSWVNLANLSGVVTTQNCTRTITGLSLAPGDKLYVLWADDNANLNDGTDDILSIGNVKWTGGAKVGAVFVISMENHNWVQPTNKFTGSLQQIYQNPVMPFVNSLVTPGNPNAAQVSWASNYTSVGVHPSEPNYIWAEAGTNFGVANDNGPYGTGGNNQNTTSHLCGVLNQLGESWMSYQEDIDLDYATGMPLAQSSWTVPLTSKSGTFTGSGTNPYNGSKHYNYQPKHNPMVFFTDTNGGNDSTHGNPQWSHYAPLQQLQADLNAGTVAGYNWITPNIDNDMHDALSSGFTYNGTTYTGEQARLAQGDNFLSKIIPMIMASQAYKNNGVIIIWEDETEGGDTASYTQPCIVISPLAKGNAYQSTLPYSHSSTLKTLEKIFQTVVLLGGSGNAGVNDLSDMFQAGVIPATP